MLNKPHLLKEAGRLLRPFWLIAVFATAMGSVSGLATAWLLASINRALYVQGDVNAALLWTFAGIVILTLFGEITSQFGNSWIGQQVIASLRKDMVAKIVTAPIDQLERYKVPKLLASLGQDVEVVSSFTLNFSSLAIAFAVTGGCIIYMVFLSRMLFAIVAVAIGISVVINRYARSKGIGGFNKSRAAQDELQKHYRAITEGAKELRLNRDRRHRVQAIQLVGVIDRIRDTRIHAMRIFMSASAFHSALFFAAIGIIVGWQGWFGIDPRVTSGFVLVLLYMKAPLGQVFGAYSAFINAEVSFKRIVQLSADFTNPEPSLLDDVSSSPTLGMHDITLSGARYAFAAEGGADPFVLGPIDLTIRQGEILFIVGENGCGKTTLIKLILGLYAPQHGLLLVGGSPVSAATRDRYRQLFSAVFFDYYLFDELVVPGGIIPPTVASYLQKLEIADKVTIEGDRFSTLDLSAGQRKRLALIQVYLEDRPVIVFDEWAAEQDPTFRRIFYTELLPDLKRQGKTLVVVSHDDRYFGVADRIIRLQAGRIVDEQPAATSDRQQHIAVRQAQ